MSLPALLIVVLGFVGWSNFGLARGQGLHDLIGSTTADQFQEAIEGGADLEQRDHEGKTPLMKASRSGRAYYVRLLIEAGADVGARDDNDWTPLLLAAGHLDQPEVVALLVEAGADIHTQNARGSTPLHMAAMFAACETVGLLLHMGASVDARDNTGITPLFEAVITEAPDCVEYLLAAGANVDARNTSGQTPLMRAAKAGNSAVRSLLQAGANVDARDQDGMTALMYASSVDATARGETADSFHARYLGRLRESLLWAMQSLIDAGANVSARDSQGWTSLSFASRYGMAEGVS